MMKLLAAIAVALLTATIPFGVQALTRAPQVSIPVAASVAGPSADSDELAVFSGELGSDGAPADCCHEICFLQPCAICCLNPNRAICECETPFTPSCSCGIGDDG